MAAKRAQMMNQIENGWALLRKLYDNVSTLDQFLLDLCGQDINERLVKPNDKKTYVNLLKLTLVCSRDKTGNRCIGHGQLSFSFEQLSSQNEIILRAIQKLLKREGPGSNQLTFGYETSSEDQDAKISNFPNLEMSYPNPSTTWLLYPAWQTLLSRVGDEVMQYLLVNTSIFLSVPSNCYIQITGIPVYLLQSSIKIKENPTINRQPNKLSVIKQNLSKTNLDPEQNLASRGKKRHAQQETTEFLSKRRKIKDPSYSENQNQVEHNSEEKKHVEFVSQEIKNLPCVDADRKSKAVSHFQKCALKIWSPSKCHYNFYEQLPRKSSFYSKSIVEKFSRKYILNKLQPDPGGALQLSKIIFGELACRLIERCNDMLKPHQEQDLINSDRSGCKNIRDKPERSQQGYNTDTQQTASNLHSINDRLAISTGSTGSFEKCMQQNVASGKNSSTRRPLDVKDQNIIKILENVLKNHRYCKYKSLLRRHCSVNCRDTMQTPVLLERHSSVTKVYLFLYRVCQKLLPRSLLGSTHNWNVFFKNILALLHLGKYETLNVGQLMVGIKITHLKWLKPLSNHSIKETAASQLLFWLMKDFILELLKANFYITETSLHRNKIFFYRKVVWRIVQSRVITDSVKKGLYVPVTKDVVNQQFAQGSALGVCHVRYLPKTTGLRPIANMGIKHTKGPHSGFSTNSLLINLFHVLTYEKNNNLENLGSSCLGLDDIYTKWKKFCSHRKQQNDDRSLYFVKADIKSCYDSMLRRKVYDIVKSLIIKEDEYIIRKYVVTMVVRGNLKKRYLREAVPDVEFEPNFIDFVKEKISQGKFNDCIFSDQVVHQHEIPSRLLKKLHSHLFNNLVKIGSGYYEQVVGISQGSIVSTLLCNLYYGAMERQYLNIERDELLMRQQDDFLFITPRLNKAKHFLSVMNEGIQEFNCCINSKKTLTNFYGKENAVPEWFPWCGFQINTRTLEIRIDYTRYAGLSMSNTQSFNTGEHAGLSLEDKLFSGLKSKVHPILFDNKLVSAEIIVQNIHQMALLSAFKFHSNAKKLPKGRKVLDNPGFFQRIIQKLAAFLGNLIERRNKKFGGNLGSVTKDCCRWLCLMAFVQKFTFHQGGYHKLLPLLKKSLLKVSKKLEVSTVTWMKNIIGTTIPLEFQMMLN